MADNFATNPGAGGNTFAADDIAGVLVPRVKIQHGVDGVAVDASASNPVPVADSAVAVALATLNGQTDNIETQLTAIIAKLSADPSTAALQTALNALVTTIRDRTPGLNGTLTDRSGTITAGGTAQQAMAANSTRQGFSVQNLSSTADLWINSLGTAAAAQPSLKLAPGAYFETPARYGALGALSVFCATTGVAFTAREW